MTDEKPQLVPFSLVPELLHRNQAVVWRLARRHNWPLLSTPGYVNRQRIAVADLERLTGFDFTAAQIADAERRHARKLREAADRLREKRAACLSLGAVFDLGLAINGVEASPDLKASARVPTKH